MIVKKKPEVDLSRKTMLFTNIGFVVALGILLFIFNKKTPLDEDALASLETINNNELDQKILDLPPPPEEKPPPPPKRKDIELKVKEDDVEVELPDDFNNDDEEEEAADFGYEEEEEETDQIFIKVEKQPQPKGGMKAFYKFVGDNLTYPSQARRMGIEGRVTVAFVVGKDGKLTDVKVLRGIGAGCDEEAVRIIKKAPPWTPGIQGAKPVRVRMVIPISFKLG